jgi:uncharacterized phage-associated protein
MRFPFNERKAGQAAAYLLQKHGGRLNYMKLIKLLYLSDRTALVKRGYPITGDRMVSMPKGPVLSGILDLINWGEKREEHSIWLEYISAPEGYDVKLATTSQEYDDLSDRDRQILDEIDAEYGKVEKWALVDLMHGLPEWEDPRGSSIPIDPAQILRAVGRSEREIRTMAENAEQALLIQELGRIELRPEY